MQETFKFIKIKKNINKQPKVKGLEITNAKIKVSKSAI